LKKDEYLERKKHLEKLSDEELKNYFFELSEQIVDPLIQLAYTHTTPSIERSILLRMGFSSIEAKTIVEKVIAKGLMGKGAGHVVYKMAKQNTLSIREAGLKIIESDVIEW
jgi:D-ornithine 4,5-aminomutase subunit alpha